MENGLASPQPGHVTKGAVQMDPMISVEWYAPHSLPTIVDTLSPQYPFLSAVGSECPSALQAVDFQVRLAFRKARRISKSFESVLRAAFLYEARGVVIDMSFLKDEWNVETTATYWSLLVDVLVQQKLDFNPLVRVVIIVAPPKLRGRTHPRSADPPRLLQRLFAELDEIAKLHATHRYVWF